MKQLCLPAFLMLFFPFAAAAQIVPTDDKGSDCVAARIEVKKTAANIPFDRAVCEKSTDASQIETCMQHMAARTHVTFLTDRCNAPDEAVYVNFNGETHEVFRSKPQTHRRVQYAGRFRGRDLIVDVIPIKLIENIYDTDEDGNRTELIGSRYRVAVTVVYRGRKTKLIGEYSDGP
ncbi:MAG: hypothetical protein KA144_08525 [Xanthomonadaceae bacterium]|nr:hypothetical protein [Xanthomonadaceae bacterium]